MNMLMKEKILEAFEALGFKTEDLGIGYGFMYEGLKFLYLPHDDDEDFFTLSIPSVLDITECSDELEFLQALNHVNNNVKYVKAIRVGIWGWLTYERELLGGEDLAKMIEQIIYALEAGINCLHNYLDDKKKEEEDDEDEDIDDFDFDEDEDDEESEDDEDSDNNEDSDNDDVTTDGDDIPDSEIDWDEFWKSAGLDDDAGK